MDTRADLKDQIKRMLVENLMLPLNREEIGDQQGLFGSTGLGLDSEDALQLVVALDRNYGLKIPDPDTARRVLQDVNSIAAAVEQHLASKAGS